VKAKVVHLFTATPGNGADGLEQSDLSELANTLRDRSGLSTQ